MLEAGVHQGVGLQGLAFQSAPHLVVLASHEDRATELPLLWDLCQSWTELGYPVVVLDATQSESADRPGLQQLLDPYSRSHERPHQRPHGRPQAALDTAWAIHPARLGLSQLCQRTTAPLAALAQLFGQHDVVLLYMPADQLAEQLEGQGIEPLLAVSAQERSVLTAYQAVKMLLVKGKLQPTLVTLVDSADPQSLAHSARLQHSLQGCAMSFLGRRVTALQVDTHAASDTSRRDMDRLALRLLETATMARYDSGMLDTPTIEPDALDAPERGKRSH